jgi:hypothetical protein
VKGPDGREYRLVQKGPYKAFYDVWGRLDRIEYDQNGDGRADQIAHHDGAKTPHLIDGKIDRVETLDAGGRIVKVEVDADRDGRMDRWQQWRGGRLLAEELDTNGDGKPDRRLVYDARGGLRAIEPLGH